MKAPLLLLAILGAFLGASLLATLAALRPPRLAGSLGPADVGLAVEEVTVRASDGVALAGWLAVRPNTPALVLLHGYPADKADLLPLAAALAPRFTVLLMDLRYFGRSGGRLTTLGLREPDDLSRAVDLLAARGLGPIGAFGFSLGGSVALLAAARDPRLRAVAAYAPFADLRDLARDLYRWLWLLRYPVVELMRGWAWLLLGADVAAVSPVTAAARLAVPVLLIASRADEQIPFAHAERLAAALRGNPRAETLLLAAGRHGELGPGFAARLADFFACALR